MIDLSERLRQLVDYVQHKPACPQSLPNVKLDFGDGWISQTSYVAPCTCGLAALLASREPDRLIKESK